MNGNSLILAVIPCLVIPILPFSIWVIALVSTTAVFLTLNRKWKSSAFSRINEMKIQREKNKEKKKDQLLFLKCTNMIRSKQFYLNGKYPIEELADDVNSNKSYISRAINSQAGMTYPQYLNKLRIDYALDLIKKDPYMSLGDVAVMSGFSHQSAFTDSFKRNVGVTPRAYLDSVMYLNDASSFVEAAPQTVVCPSMMMEEGKSNLSQFS